MSARSSKYTDNSRSSKATIASLHRQRSEAWPIVVLELYRGITTETVSFVGSGYGESSTHLGKYTGLGNAVLVCFLISAAGAPVSQD